MGVADADGYVTQWMSEVGRGVPGLSNGLAKSPTAAVRRLPMIADSFFSSVARTPASGFTRRVGVTSDIPRPRSS